MHRQIDRYRKNVDRGKREKTGRDARTIKERKKKEKKTPIIGLRVPPSDSRLERRPLRLAGGYDEEELTGSQIRERGAQVSEYRSYPSIVHGMSRFLLMSHGQYGAQFHINSSVDFPCLLHGFDSVIL